MLPLRSHLTLKRGIFYYRRKLPLPHIGEVAVSLRTSHYREAQHLARVADLAFRSFFRSVLSMADVQAILRQHLVDALEEDRARHLSTPHGRPVYVQGGQLDDHDCPVDADLELIGALLSDAREALATRNVKRVAHLVQTYMALHDFGESQRHALAMGLLKADVQALETSERRLVDGVVDEIQLFPASSSSGERGTVAPASGPLLSEVLPSFMGLMSTEGGWRAQTLMQNKKTYQIFLEVCGDLPVGAYKRPELAKTLDLLRALPDDYGKAKRWRGLALREIAEISKGSESRLAVKTLKRHLAALGSLFKHLIERGEYEGANPAHGFSFPEKMRPKMKRQQWDGDRLTKLFNSPVWTGCKSKSSRSKAGSLVVKDDKYWLPLLGLYHGNRLEEFAQLIRSDLRREDSIWYFDINDDGDKQVKNEQSKRRVPVHPQLLALGLIEYIEDIAPSSSDPLFPQLKPGGADGKRGHAFTKWWTRYRKEVGLYEPGLDYHSFRHGVTTKLFASGVSEVFVDELTGHEGKGTSRAVYTKEMPLRKLYEAICQVEWPEVSITP